MGKEEREESHQDGDHTHFQNDTSAERGHLVPVLLL